MKTMEKTARPAYRTVTLAEWLAASVETRCRWAREMVVIREEDWPAFRAHCERTRQAFRLLSGPAAAN
jgi:hypothetical protein